MQCLVLLGGSLLSESGLHKSHLIRVILHPKPQGYAPSAHSLAPGFLVNESPPGERVQKVSQGHRHPSRPVAGVTARTLPDSPMFMAASTLDMLRKIYVWEFFAFPVTRPTVRVVRRLAFFAKSLRRHINLQTQPSLSCLVEKVLSVRNDITLCQVSE